MNFRFIPATHKTRTVGMLMTALLATACTSDDIATSDADADIVGSVILFQAGTGSTGGSTRAATEDDGKTVALNNGKRFVLRMFHDKSTDSKVSEGIYNADPTDVHMTVNGTRGICYYTKDDYTAGTDESPAQKLYWLNRRHHGFLAYTLDGDEGDPSFSSEITTGGKTFGGGEHSDDTGTYLTYDMSAWAHNVHNDPMLAVAEKQPWAGTNEANRVSLIFEHQFSLIEVNVKADNNTVGAGTGAAREEIFIDNITLEGLAQEARIYTSLNQDRSHEPTQVSDDTPITVTMCDANGGTSVQTGEGDDYGRTATAYALGCGTLRTISIEWHEKMQDGMTADVPHVSYFTYNNEADMPKLQPGKKYRYNITLKRGTIAFVQADVVAWEQADYDAEIHSSNGFIQK